MTNTEKPTDDAADKPTCRRTKRQKRPQSHRATAALDRPRQRSCPCSDSVHGEPGNGSAPGAPIGDSVRSRLTRTPVAGAEKNVSFERISSIRETNGSFDACVTHVNGWKPAVYMSYTIESKLAFFAHRIYLFNTYVLVCYVTRATPRKSGRLKTAVQRNGSGSRTEDPEPNGNSDTNFAGQRGAV